jgi:hypothetical protein
MEKTEFCQYYWVMSKAKESIPATQKALQAWQSELRKLEKRLGEWSEALAERERILEEQEQCFEQAVETADDAVVQRYAQIGEDPDTMIEDECDCGPEEAAAGCDCPKCERRNKIANHRLTKPEKPEIKGDEVTWLEELWRLEDKRKKK